MKNWMYGWVYVLLSCGLAFGQSTAPSTEETVPTSDSTIIADGSMPPSALPGNIAFGDYAPATPAPAAPAPAAPTSVWDTIPPVFVFSRPGEFAVPPEDCGYYSLQDALQGNLREKPPVFPYGRISLKPYPFYDVDYRYLDKPTNTQYDWSDCLKRQQIGDSCWMFTTGGEIRNRYMNEVNSRLTGTNNSYDLLRTMIYGSLWYGDQFGFFVQGLDAHSFGHELAPLPIDVDRTDLVDFFVDVRLFEYYDKPVYARAGRQELNLGSQRLVSDLEWANTLRTFDGVRVFRQSEKFDLTAFWMQPVVPDPSNFDSPDNDRNFTGVWGTWRPEKGHFIDAYALNLDRGRPLAVGGGGVVGQSNITTLGTRYAGNNGNILWDFEGMMQFGAWSNQNLLAGAGSAGLGYHFSDRCWHPQLWINYDYASGDGNPGVGNSFNTFQQQFPFGHYYLGYLDLVGRQNIHDFHTQFVMYPTNWITCLSQFHHFRLDSPRSPLFNAAGNATRVDPTGAAGTDVGNEIDFLVNFHLNTHQDILIGYSKLFAGSFIENTGNPDSPEVLYLQHQYRW